MWLDHPILALQLSTAILAIGVILGRRAKGGMCTITVLPNTLSIQDDRPVKGEPPETVLPFSEVQGIRILQKPSTRTHELVIVSNKRSKTIGTGLSLEALRWLKGCLTMEIAGLTWKPIFDVGRKTTRKRAAPIEDLYKHKPGLPKRLIKLFLEHAPETMHGLRKAVEARDAIEIKRKAHWLKSGSANVGASHLSELCQLLEIHALNNDLSKIDTLFIGIEEEFTKVETTFKERQDKEAHDGTAGLPPEPLPRYDVKYARGPRSKDAHKPEIEKSIATNVDWPEGPASPLVGAKVLLVEDSPINQRVALEFLSDFGCDVEIAEGGQQAFDAHGEKMFDIIFMDCQMPDVDGFQATRMIRAREREVGLRPVPIIALTANALRGDRDQCLVAGMDDYVSKPFAPERLGEVLRKWLIERNGEPSGAEGMPREPTSSAGIGVDKETPANAA